MLRSKVKNIKQLPMLLFDAPKILLYGCEGFTNAKLLRSSGMFPHFFNFRVILTKLFYKVLWVSTRFQRTVSKIN